MRLEIQGGDILARQLIGWRDGGVSDCIESMQCKTLYVQVCSEHRHLPEQSPTFTPIKPCTHIKSCGSDCGVVWDESRVALGDWQV